MENDRVTKADFENLAQMIARGFSETATKDDIRDLDRKFEGLEMKISSYASRWTENFAKLHEWVQELENRLRLLEKSGEKR